MLSLASRSLLALSSIGCFLEPSTAQHYLVVGHPALLEALEPLCEHREAEGLSVERLEWKGAVEDALALRRRVHARIRAVTDRDATPGYLVLVGDATGPFGLPALERPGLRSFGLPHGADRIASDGPYADLDDDGKPEWAYGRLTVENAAEARAVAAKIVEYEQAPPTDDGWQRELALIANSGDFGALIDRALESAMRELLRDALAPGVRITGAVGIGGTPLFVEPDRFLERVLASLDRGPFAAVYAGHGTVRGFAKVAGRPVLRRRDVAGLTGAARTFLVAFACHIAEFEKHCLGEVLLRHDGGPFAVIAATGVSFPYGDVLLAREMLRQMQYRENGLRIGDLVRGAFGRLLDGDRSDAFRVRAELLAETLGYDGEARTRLRRYTADLYHVLGDPATRLRLPRPLELAVSPASDDGLSVTVSVPDGDRHPPRVRVELCVDRGADFGDGRTTDVLDAFDAEWDEGRDPVGVEVQLPAEAAEFYWLRAYGRDDASSWAGGTRWRQARRR